MDNINTEHIIHIIKFHWKKLAIIAFVSIACSAVFSSSLFIKPKYKSKAVVFPANLLPYSEESNTEQLLQYLNSEELKNSIAKQFHLLSHYGIDSTGVKVQSKLTEYFKENISFSTNMYESVDIEVIDVSPVLAQQMVKAIIEEANQLISSSKRILLKEYIANYEHQLAIKQNEIDSIQHQLQTIRTTYHILDVNAQFKALSKRMGQSISESDKALLIALQQHGDEFLVLQHKLNGELKSYKELKLSYDKNTLDYNGNVSFTTIISQPNLPDNKCAPLRMVIVLLTTMSALLLALMILLFNHKKN